ncbi:MULTISPECIES: hypothetical protein [Aphanothece]|uniref:hypothetical protein n=1 Tax=Aphanothece TaxID=1121 RepID=UPI00398F0E5B
MTGIEMTVLQQVDHANDGIQRRSDVMAHVGEKASLRFARGKGFVPGLLQLLCALLHLLLKQIARFNQAVLSLHNGTLILESEDE